MIGTGIGLGLSGFRLKSGPSTIPERIAGLELWLDAADSNTLFQSSGGSAATFDGDPVGQWLDKSAKGRHATQTDGTKKPALKLSGKNGLNVMQFDGSNDLLSISGSASSLKFLHSTDSTVFIVFKYTTLNDGALFDSIDGSSARTGIFLYATSAGSLQLLIARSSGSASTSTVSNASTSSYIPADFVLSSLVSNPTNATASQRSFVYKNGGNLFSNNTAGGVASTADATRDLMIGAFNPGIGTLNGFICELIIYSSALSGTNRGLVEAYLNSKWSIY
jgi:hypothetical protein